MEEQLKEKKEFIEKYKQLCDEFKLRIIAVPVFDPTNHETFEIGIEYRVIPFNTENYF